MKTVLRLAKLAVRAALLVIVASVSFAQGWPGTWHFAVVVAATAVSAVQLALWAPADFRPQARLRYAFLLPYALAAVTLTCGAAAGTPTGGEFEIQAVLAGLTAASDTSLTAGLIVVGLGIVGCEVVGALRPGAVYTLEHPAILIAAWLVGRDLLARQRRAEQSVALLAKADELREEQTKVAALDERARIAREIHDVLAHSLGALGLQLQAAQAVLATQHDEARAVELLAQARRLAQDGLSETRRAVHALRGETRPLPDGLAELSAEHQRRHGAPVTFQISGEPRPLPPDTGLALVRTAQEALVNTAKHAPRQPVDIRLDYADAHTGLAVTNHLGADAPGDPGPGLATIDGGYGLAGMRERLLLVGGTLNAGRSGGDWTVEARIPR
jgi:signal transduction histidine kinase